MLPLFYFPSTIIAIDDNQESLDAIKRMLPKNYRLITFSDPIEAKEFLLNFHSLFETFPFYSHIEDECHDLEEHCQVDFNLSKLIQLRDLPNKINEISAIIVDENMPGLTGLELCKIFKDSPIRKNLLTGQSGSLDVIEAFNEKLINHFMEKDCKNIAEEIKKSIDTLSQDYFEEQTKPFLKHLEAKRLLPLSDKIFIQFFQSWKAKNDIIEYYLIDKTGSFLCFDSEGRQYYFITHTKNSLEDFFNFCAEENIDIPEDVINFKRIPFFGEWHSLLEETKPLDHSYYQAEMLSGREKYWIAIKLL